MTRDPVETLLIEDDRTFTVALQAVLGDAPCYRYEITIVHTLRGAMDALKAKSFDLILLDLKLPDADEAQAVIAIRAVAEEVPLVIITGLEDKAVQDAAFAAMVSDFIVKPCANEEILHRVRTAVAAHRAGRRFARMDRALERAEKVIEMCEQDPKLPPYS